jgi:hypothetical protein
VFSSGLGECIRNEGSREMVSNLSLGTKYNR